MFLRSEKRYWDVSTLKPRFSCRRTKKLVVQQCLQGDEKSCFKGKKKIAFQWCFYGGEKVFSTVKRKMFQRVFNGKKNDVSSVRKKLLGCFNVVRSFLLPTEKNQWFNSVYRVTKKVVSTVRKNGVSTVGKKVVSTVKRQMSQRQFKDKKRACFNGVKKVLRTEKNGVSMVFLRWGKKLFRRCQERCSNGNTIETPFFFPLQQLFARR